MFARTNELKLNPIAVQIAGLSELLAPPRKHAGLLMAETSLVTERARRASVAGNLRQALELHPRTVIMLDREAARLTDTLAECERHVAKARAVVAKERERHASDCATTMARQNMPSNN